MADDFIPRRVTVIAGHWGGTWDLLSHIPTSVNRIRGRPPLGRQGCVPAGLFLRMTS